MIMIIASRNDALFHNIFKYANVVIFIVAVGALAYLIIKNIVKR